MISSSLKVFNLSETPRSLQPETALVPKWLELTFTHPNTDFESGYCSDTDKLKGSCIPQKGNQYLKYSM